MRFRFPSYPSLLPFYSSSCIVSFSLLHAPLLTLAKIYRRKKSSTIDKCLYRDGCLNGGSEPGIENEGRKGAWKKAGRGEAKEKGMWWERSLHTTATHAFLCSSSRVLLSHTLHVHRKHSRTTEIQRDPSRWSTRPNVPCFRSPEPSLSIFIHSQHILFSRPLLFLATIASPCHALYILPSLVVYHTNHALCSRHSARICVVRIEGREGKGGKK